MNEINISFDGVRALPHQPIDPSAGPASSAFFHRGLVTVLDTAIWLRDLPYAPSTGTGMLRVLEEGFGDCTAKHAALITLTKELGLVVNLIWGIYALDARLVPAVAPVLATVGLPFVPNIHCFVQSAGSYIDLTEGNCTGKNRQVEHYLALFPASPGDHEQPVLLAFAQLLATNDHRFFSYSANELLLVINHCVRAKAAACVRPAVVAGGTGAGSALQVAP